MGEAASALEQMYAAPLRYLHWLLAGGTIGAFAAVRDGSAQQGPDTWMMNLHKSLGVTASSRSPRPDSCLRLTTKIPAPVPGSSVEHLAAAAGHAAMYGFVVVMPTTGFAGYFGGKGLPFFGYTIPGAAERDGKLAGRAFKLHKQLGYYYQLFVPVHVGAVGFHALKGQNILRRMGVAPFG